MRALIPATARDFLIAIGSDSPPDRAPSFTHVRIGNEDVHLPQSVFHRAAHPAPHVDPAALIVQVQQIQIPAIGELGIDRADYRPSPSARPQNCISVLVLRVLNLHRGFIAFP